MPAISRFEDHEVDPRSGKRVDVDARPLRPLRPVHPICSQCRRRPAVTRVRGRYVVLEDHDLCRQCWRAGLDATREEVRARREALELQKAGICAHDWQPISGWHARYRCAICQVIGRKLAALPGQRGRGTGIEPYRCEAKRGGARCKQLAVHAWHGKNLRCAEHRHAGRAGAARKELGGAGASEAGTPREARPEAAPAGSSAKRT